MNDLDSQDLKNLHSEQLLTQEVNAEIFCVVVIRKVRHSVLNASICTEVAIFFFTSSAMASSAAQPSVSFSC